MMNEDVGKLISQKYWERDIDNGFEKQPEVNHRAFDLALARYLLRIKNLLLPVPKLPAWLDGRPINYIGNDSDEVR